MVVANAVVLLELKITLGSCLSLARLPSGSCPRKTVRTVPVVLHQTVQVSRWTRPSFRPWCYWTYWHQRWTLTPPSKVFAGMVPDHRVYGYVPHICRECWLPRGYWPWRCIAQMQLSILCAGKCVRMVWCACNGTDRSAKVPHVVRGDIWTKLVEIVHAQ